MFLYNAWPCSSWDFYTLNKNGGVKRVILTEIMNRNALKQFVFSRKYRFSALAEKGMLNWIPDSIYLKMKYRVVMGEKLNLRNPKTFNEKLQWLKIHNRKPIYTQMVDKYEAKKYIADMIGAEYVIPTYGVWDHFDDIDFDMLPNQFVLKTTHDSGGVVICDDKRSFDFQKAKAKLEPRLKQNFYWHGREWPYKNVKPRILAEKILTEEKDDVGGTGRIEDYKMMCFDGAVECSFVCSGRDSERGLHVTFYDNEWAIMPFERHYPRETTPVMKPNCFEKMKAIAGVLSKGFPFIRIDFYEVNGNLYVGELTFYPGSGFEEFSPREWDTILGEKIKSV